MKEILTIFLIGIMTVGHTGGQGFTSGSPGIHSQNDNSINQSITGIDFRTLAANGSREVWLVGSVFGVEGFLVKASNSIKRAQLISAVEFIQDLSVTTANHGWIVADGLLYKTTNGALSWQKIRVVEDRSLLKTVSFITNRVGWVAGRNGIILHTRDGGITWQRQNSSTDFTIQEIRFVDENKGWAIGSNISSLPTKKILLLTADAGVTWRKAPGSDLQQFRSVMFVSSQVGWAINGNNEIVQSSDGGESWVVRRAADGSSWGTVFFVDQLNGWAVGDGIIHTTDGGRIWKYQLRTTGLAEESLDKVVFLDSRNGWAMNLFKVLSTHDGGRTWKPIPDSWKPAIVRRVRRDKFRSL